MGIKFTPNWQKPQHLPFNKKQITTILKSSSGPVGYFARANDQDVVVTAGIHQGGRPNDKNPDMRHHITVQLPNNHGTRHVVLKGSAHKPSIYKIT